MYIYTWFPSWSSSRAAHESQPPSPTTVSGPVQLPAHSTGQSKHSPSVALLYVSEKHDLSVRNSSVQCCDSFTLSSSDVCLLNNQHALYNTHNY